MLRRTVLKMFSLAAISKIAPLDQLARLENRRFESEIFGIRLTTPASWHSMLPADYIELSDLDYGEKNPKVPILACTKFAEPVSFENDTIQIFADRMCQSDLELPPREKANYRPLDLEEVSLGRYLAPATTVDGRQLNFERDNYAFNDGQWKFHIELEWDASKPNRSEDAFREVLASIEVAHDVVVGWEKEDDSERVT